MSGPPPPPKPGGGLSLYADLLDPPESSASISRAPVVSQQALDAIKEQEAAAKKTIDPALRFQPIQPIRRPQQKTQKPKGIFPKGVPAGVGAAGAGKGTPAVPGAGAGAATAGAAAPPVKSTLADWAAADDDEWMYAGEKRPRGGNNKKKKKKHNAHAETDWDEIYDPSRPTNVDEYLRSDERIREVREWKALLYRHKRPAAKRQSSWDSDDGEDRPMTNQFAPPNSYSFAPPPVSPPRASLPDDKTGDDAYARRIALSQGNTLIPPPRSPTPPPPPPPHPPHAEPILPTSPPPLPPPEPDSATISRAPVRYTQPEAPAPPAGTNNPDPDAMDEDAPEDASDPDAPRTSRPGQKGFAARLMSKYGWSKGEGLGAEGTGITAPLRVQVEKRKKKPDAEGGGWAQPGGGRGRIIEPAQGGGKKNGAAEGGASRFGPTSSVIVLRHMLDNIADPQSEIEDGLGQEIGEECGDKYGRVERLYVDVPGRNVYIKFVDQVSALRAVNSLDGRVFAGSAIAPRFYDVDLFERGVYE